MNCFLNSKLLFLNSIIIKNIFFRKGLCPECSIKLNYRSQKREAKRRKSLKRLGQSSTSKEEVSGPSDDQEIEIKDEEESEAEPGPTDEKVAAEDESKIWREKPSQNVEKSREEEFEEYLADLFL